MRALLLAVAVAFLPALTAQAQTSGSVSALDLLSGTILPIANGDLGSGHIVALFLVTPQQLTALGTHPDAVGAVARSGANHVEAV